MPDIYDSIVPLIIQSKDGMDQIGSSVLLSVADSTFLLTAAHVADGLRGKVCLIPTSEGLEQVKGWLSVLRLPNGMSREDDKVDTAYFRLDSDLVKRLRVKFVPLDRRALRLTDNRQPKDIYTFAGYPHRKTKVHGHRIRSEMYSYTGYLANEDLYRSQGYNQRSNILIEYDREHSMSRNGKKLLPPLPHGISGGAIFANSKDKTKVLAEEGQLQLVGIGHTYRAAKNYLAGTTINVYLNAIRANHPELFDRVESTESKDEAVPMFLGIIYYREADYDRILGLMDDRERLFQRWDQWRNTVEDGIERFATDGKVLLAVELAYDEFSEYCERNGVAPNAKARLGFVNWKMARMVEETLVQDGT